MCAVACLIYFFMGTFGRVVGQFHFALSSVDRLFFLGFSFFLFVFQFMLSVALGGSVGAVELWTAGSSKGTHTDPCISVSDFIL